MASTTNYNWNTPDNSGLVKNGAQDIRTLGSAIDTSVWNIGFGQAGKNKIINGDFGIWQRGTSFTPAPASIVYTADRFYNVVASGTTVSRQTFTAGSAPVAGYEGQFYMNQTITANNQNYETGQRIENARTFAGQTVTLSFWARSTVGAQPLSVGITQNFGTGGSPSTSVFATYVSGSGSPYTPTSSWQRFTFTFSVPSVTGKTFGTNNDSNLYVKLFQYTTTATNTSIDIWGVQLEAGSFATPFQTATGTIQGELAACQRYYFRTVANSSYGRLSQFGNAIGATQFVPWVQPPVPMRTTPTAIEYGGNLGAGDNVAMAAAITSLSLSTQSNNSYIGIDSNVASGLTTYRPYNIIANNSSTAYLAASAEL